MSESLIKKSAAKVFRSPIERFCSAARMPNLVALRAEPCPLSRFQNSVPPGAPASALSGAVGNLVSEQNELKDGHHLYRGGSA